MFVKLTVNIFLNFVLVLATVNQNAKIKHSSNLIMKQDIEIPVGANNYLKIEKVHKFVKICFLRSWLKSLWWKKHCWNPTMKKAIQIQVDTTYTSNIIVCEDIFPKILQLVNSEINHITILITFFKDRVCFH